MLGLLVVGGIVFFWVSGIWVAYAQATVKGRRADLWLMAAVLTGWLAAVTVLALPEPMHEPRACPRCRSRISGLATRCPRCAADIERAIDPTR